MSDTRKEKKLPNNSQPIATTDYNEGQAMYILPMTTMYNPIDRVEIYNSHKKLWQEVSYNIVLELPRKKLKNEKIIKIYYKANT